MQRPQPKEIKDVLFQRRIGYTKRGALLVQNSKNEWIYCNSACLKTVPPEWLDYRQRIRRQLDAEERSKYMRYRINYILKDEYERLQANEKSPQDAIDSIVNRLIQSFSLASERPDEAYLRRKFDKFVRLAHLDLSYSDNMIRKIRRELDKLFLQEASYSLRDDRYDEYEAADWQDLVREKGYKEAGKEYIRLWGRLPPDALWAEDVDNPEELVEYWKRFVPLVDYSITQGQEENKGLRQKFTRASEELPSPKTPDQGLLEVSQALEDAAEALEDQKAAVQAQEVARKVLEGAASGEEVEEVMSEAQEVAYKALDASQPANVQEAGAQVLKAVQVVQESTDDETVPEPQTIKERMITLREIYSPAYRFPEWSIDAALQNKEVLMKSVKVYYHASDNVNHVKRLVREREPVNIEAKRYYNMRQLGKVFGWKTGFYNRLYKETGEVAPNIAVYTPTYVNLGKTFYGYMGQRYVVHILNAVGYAYDNQDQVDYKVLMTIRGESSKDTKAQHIAFARNNYKRLFTLIFLAARRLGMQTIVMSLVGAGNFASKWPYGGKWGFQSQVWMPVWHKAYQRLKDEFNIKFMGVKKEQRHWRARATKPFIKTFINIEDLGRFPDFLLQGIDRRTTLLINAWDPLSLPGNGNAMDDSLDGYIGRLTNIAVTGSLITNPYIKLQAVSKRKQIRESSVVDLEPSPSPQAASSGTMSASNEMGVVHQPVFRPRRTPLEEYKSFGRLRQGAQNPFIVQYTSAEAAEVADSSDDTQSDPVVQKVVNSSDDTISDPVAPKVVESSDKSAQYAQFTAKPALAQSALAQSALAQSACGNKPSSRCAKNIIRKRGFGTYKTLAAFDKEIKRARDVGEDRLAELDGNEYLDETTKKKRWEAIDRCINSYIAVLTYRRCKLELDIKEKGRSRSESGSEDNYAWLDE